MNKNANTESIALRLFSGRAILAFIIVMSATSAVQAEWRFEPKVKVGGEKDDNPTLSVSTDDVLDDTGYLIDFRTRFVFRS